MKALFAAAAVLVLGAPAYAQPDPNAQTQPDVVTNSGPQVRDARGIPVINEAPVIPEGVNQRVDAPPGTRFVYSPNQQAMFAPRPATMEYPPCQRGQTDRCVQTYERGVRSTRSRPGRR